MHECGRGRQDFTIVVLCQFWKDKLRKSKVLRDQVEQPVGVVHVQPMPGSRQTVKRDHASTFLPSTKW